VRVRASVFVPGARMCVYVSCAGLRACAYYHAPESVCMYVRADYLRSLPGPPSMCKARLAPRKMALYHHCKFLAVF